MTLRYDFFGRIIEILTDDDRHVRYEYDNYGDLVAVTLPDNSKWEYEYEHYTFTTNSQTYTDSRHLLPRETKPDGRIVANTYDNLRRLTIQAATVGINRELITNAWFFYTNNCVSLTNDLLAGVTRIEDVFHNAYFYHYSNSLITRIEEPLGRTTIQDWFEAGETGKTGYYPRSLELAVNSRNLTNEFRYDASGNLTTQIFRGDLTGEGSGTQSATNTFTFANNLPTSMTDPSGNRTAFIYDDPGDAYRVTRQERSNGGGGISTNRYSYTNVTQTVDMGGWSKTNRAFGLRTRVVRADTATNEWRYDGRGFVVQSIHYARTGDDSGNTDPPVTNYFAHSARGDLIEIADGAGRRARKGYDAMGRIQWRDVFDEFGTALSRETFYYNRNGDLEWYDGPRSGPEDYMHFDYDGAGRKVEEIHWRSRASADASGVEAEEGDALYATTFYKYDPFGNLLSVTNPRRAITTNQWDALGRLVQAKALDTDGSTLLTTEGFAYEPGGLVRYHTNALGGVAEIQYTSTGQPRFRRTPDGATNGWTYWLDGRVRRQIQNNGAYSEFTYDDANRRVTRIFYSPSAALETNIIEFDRRGNLFRVEDA